MGVEESVTQHQRFLLSRKRGAHFVGVKAIYGNTTSVILVRLWDGRSVHYHHIMIKTHNGSKDERGGE